MSITTEKLVEKATRFLTTNAKDKVVEALVEEAIIKADRDIRVCDSLSPLAWDIMPWDGIRTSTYAKISAATQADPGVLTAASVDSGVTGHGFRDNSSTHQDIVIIDGIAGMEELNKRAFLLEYVDATTFSLKTLDGLDAVDTSDYTAYSSGGVIYHAGLLLDASLILANVNSKWTFKRVLPGVKFDNFPTDPISEATINREPVWLEASNAQRPKRFRYWQLMTAANTYAHYLMWYPAANSDYSLSFPYQKEVPDIDTFDGSTYPFHPDQVHPALWHGALANLVGESQKMRRENKQALGLKLEVLWAQKWIKEFEQDKIEIINLSRQMLGASGGSGGLSG